MRIGLGAEGPLLKGWQRMRQSIKARAGMAALALVALGLVAACEAPLPVAPVVSASPEASASEDPLGPPSL